MFGLNLKQGWLSLVKYVVIIVLVIWIWRSMRTDSAEYFGTPILADSTKLNGYSEKFEVNDVNVLNRLNVGASNETLPENGGEGQCTSCSAGGESEEGVKLLPVMDPLFNMREICKQCILLEDHLNSPDRRCSDCINKHSLTIEALAEEAVGLDSDRKLNFLPDLVKKCRNLQKECNRKDLDKRSVAQKYRHIRKALMPLCHDKC